jgi:hypothetical protein
MMCLKSDDLKPHKSIHPNDLVILVVWIVQENQIENNSLLTNGYVCVFIVIGFNNPNVFYKKNNMYNRLRMMFPRILSLSP